MADKLLDFNGLSKYTTKMLEKFNAFVPKTRTINDKPLSDNIKLTYSDVGAQVAGSYVPTSRKINNKDLSKDITLTASDINGIPSTDDFVPKTRTVNSKALSSDISLDAVDIGIVDTNKNSVIISNSSSTFIYDNHSVIIGAGTTAALKPNTVVIGYAAGLGPAMAGSNSVCIGSQANLNGSQSVSIGSMVNARSDLSVIIGLRAKTDQTNFTVTKNVLIGNDTIISGANGATGVGAHVNISGNYSVALGYNASAPDPNTIQLGDSRISSLQCAVVLKTTSDERDKTDITPISDGAVEFLKHIKAIRYRRNPRTSYIQEEKYDEEGNVTESTRLSDEDRTKLRTFGLCSYDKEAHARGDKKGERVRVGVLAQNVQEALRQVYGDPSYGNLVDDNFYDHDPSTIPEGVENQLSIAYSNFIPFLIKAIQEQQDTIENLQNRIEVLESANLN